MIEVGYKLSSEEFGAPALVEQAIRAERAGFAFALASDHFHPWTDRQGQSPFVWAVLGAIARATFYEGDILPRFRPRARARGGEVTVEVRRRAS
jgi:hypothetical protein